MLPSYINDSQHALEIFRDEKVGFAKMRKVGFEAVSLISWFIQGKIQNLSIDKNL